MEVSPQLESQSHGRKDNASKGRSRRQGGRPQRPQRPYIPRLLFPPAIAFRPVTLQEFVFLFLPPRGIDLDRLARIEPFQERRFQTGGRLTMIRAFALKLRLVHLAHRTLLIVVVVWFFRKRKKRRMVSSSG